MLVKEIMVPREHLLTADPDDTVLDAMKIMVENRVGSLLIMDPSDETKVSGIITSYDLMKSFVGDEGNGTGTKLGTIMSTEIIAVNENDKTSNIASVMDKHRTHHLIVRNTKGELAGILSTFDIVREGSLAADVHPWVGPDTF